MFNYRSKFATTPSSFRLLRRSQVAKLYEDIERNVADAGVYQHLNHIATGRLFFPQEKLLLSGQRSAVSGQRSAVSGQRSAVSGQRSAVRKANYNFRVNRKYFLAENRYL
jgi:biotin synthase-like enzyme